MTPVLTSVIIELIADRITNFVIFMSSVIFHHLQVHHIDVTESDKFAGAEMWRKSCVRLKCNIFWTGAGASS